MFSFRPMRRRAVLLVAGLLASAAPASAWTAEAPLKVVASFSILGDMVREVGGPHIALTTLVGPDGDAHEYEPTPADARTLAAAQVLIVNGLAFEAWLPRLLKSSGFSGTTVVASEGVVPRKFGQSPPRDAHDHDHDHAHVHEAPKHGHAHAHSDLDPHAWQNLAYGAIYVRNVAAGLAAADPAHAADYARRADAYVARIAALDEKVKKTFAAIAPQRRKVVSSHDAFGYFGDAYGITFISPLGAPTDAEPSAADVANIIRQVRQDKIPAVFVENISSPKLVQQIARETGAKVGGTLYSDALSQPGQPGATYLEMFEWNARQLAAALEP